MRVDSLPCLIAILLVFQIEICSAQNSVGTPDERNALFDTLVNRTVRWEAWSPFKDRKNAIDYQADAEYLRASFVDAITELDLVIALQKLSNLRHDRHLFVRENFSSVSSQVNNAAIKFWPDFSKDVPSVFVMDTSLDFSSYTTDKLQFGDELVEVNGIALVDYYEMLSPFLRFSTPNQALWEFAETVSTKSQMFDQVLYRPDDTVRYTFQSTNGSRYDVLLPWLPKRYDFTESGERSLPGYEFLFGNIDVDMYVKHLPDNVIVLLLWRDFEDLTNTVERIVRVARDLNLLRANVILDISESSGGSGAPELIRILSQEPFQTTWGNVRIGDYLDDFKLRFSGNVREWLDTDVALARANGAEYSANVPFKLQYFQKYQDGIMQPSSERFTGKVVMISGSNTGSQVDQCAAMMIDNAIPIASLGMSCGGYSNTWEYEPTISFPKGSTSSFEYHWNIGHTIRPNGEVLEGNPAQPTNVHLLTAQNYATYYDDLIRAAEDSLSAFKVDCGEGIESKIAVQNDGSLAVTVINGVSNYQWYENDLLLDNESKRFLVRKPSNGSTYRVAFLLGGCSISSELYTYENVLKSQILETSHILLYPNPTKRFLYITDPGLFEHITLFQLDGKRIELTELRVLNFSETKRIDLRGIDSGIYFLNLTYPNAQVVTKKIIIN